MTRELTVAVLQCPLGGPRTENVDRVIGHIEAAARRGAQVILPPELFEGPYFPREEDERFFEAARPFEDNPTLERLRGLAREHGVVIPFSFFERAGPAHYNSLAMIDADGAVLGLYRKSHIPDGPGYEEKFYFRPGDTGIRAWSTRHGRIGVGICWDQWFPECARIMALDGAEILLYPTAIGSEPVSAEDTGDPWQRAMVGHAVSNAMPVAAANRTGNEGGQIFYGRSFIADARGDKVAELGRDDEGVLLHTFDLDALHARRGAWGFFRDRRPELYRALLTADGKTPSV
jgi:N-carbamoylputrescine amidase